MTVTDWLRAHMHELRTVDPADDDWTDLEPLRAIVGDARVVAIGESTHRVHEFYAARHRLTRFLATELADLLPLLDHGPADRSGLAWQLPVLQAYMALPVATRYELTARITELAERVAAMQVVYADRAGAPAAEIALRCAITARHGDAFLAAMTLGAERTFEGHNVRDRAMAENVEWILGGEDRIVLAAANGHVQRGPFHVPPFVPRPMTMLGEHLARVPGLDTVVVASAYGGGTQWLHRSVPDAPAGHTEVFTEDIGPFDDPRALDTVLAGAGFPVGLLDLRTVPADGPVADRFATVEGLMNGPTLQLADPRIGYDAAVYVDRITPWHTTIRTPTW